MKILILVFSILLFFSLAPKMAKADEAQIAKVLAPYCDPNKILSAKGSRVGSKLYMSIYCIDPDGRTTHRLLFRVFHDGTLSPYPEVHLVD